MPAESETYEEKSEYGGTDRERLKLVKSIVAMANTRGGTIHIERVTNGARELDSASLDGIVNSYVGPPVRGITSEVQLDGFTVIRVDESDQKPHVIMRTASYRDHQDNLKYPFHKGQIWMRHCSSNGDVTPDDLAQLVQTAAGRLLERLGTQIRQPGFVLRSDDSEAMPVRLGDDADAVTVRVDTSVAYPYTRKDLADELQREYNWVSKAMQTLDLEHDRQYAYAERNAAGRPVLWRYSEEARSRLLDRLDADPDWNPRSRD